MYDKDIVEMLTSNIGEPFFGFPAQDRYYGCYFQYILTGVEIRANGIYVYDQSHVAYKYGEAAFLTSAEAEAHAGGNNA